MALSFIAKATDRHVNVVARALRELQHRRIIKKYAAATFRLPASWGIRPVEEWRESPCKVRLTSRGDTREDFNCDPLANDPKTVTSGGSRRLTGQGDTDSPREVVGDPPREVTKKEKERNSYRKEIEKNSPLKIGPKGPFVQSAEKRASDALSKNLSNSKDTLSGASPLPGDGTPQRFQTQDEFLKALLDSWNGVVDVQNISRQDSKTLDGILERSPEARAAILSEFKAAVDAVKTHPGILDNRLDSTPEGFFHVLRNRKQIVKPDPVQPKKPDPAPMIQWFTEETGFEVNLTQDDLQEFSRLMTGLNASLFQKAFFKGMSDIKGAQIPEQYKERPNDILMLIARHAANQALDGNGR